MKIALCLEYPVRLRGGVSVLVETLFRELAQRGHKMVLVSPDSASSLSETETGSFVSNHIFWQPKHHPSISNAKKLAGQLADLKIDIAHFHAGGNYGWGNRFPFYSPLPYLDRLNVPCVWTSHSVTTVLTGYCGDLKPLWFKALLLPLGWLGKMHQLRHTKREITVSRHDYEKLRRWYLPLSNRLLQVYHSRLKLETQDPSSKDREPVILNVGHIAQRKGQLVLAEAFAQIADRHPGWRLEFAGHFISGGIAEQIERIAIQKGISGRIRLLGQRDDAIELMKRAAIYVQPSLEEALGLALQEAMSSGCACIGSRVGGIPELIENSGTGILLAPNNPRELAEALEELIKNESLRRRMGYAAAASLETRGMTLAGMTKRHLDLYEQIVNRR